MSVWPNGTLAIVEDSDVDYAMFERVFNASVPITRWASAEAALASFEANDPGLADLVLLVVDLHLPGIDGAELIERARAREGGDVPTMCVLSTSKRPADQERAIASGANGYFVKPDTLAELRTLPERLAAVTAAR